MRNMLSCLLFFAAVAALGAGQPSLVAVTVELPHSTLLPGVPFDMTIRYTNLTDRRIAAGATARVTITPIGAPPITMERWAFIDEADFPTSPRNFELEPRGTATGVIRWDNNWFYDDAAVTVPGTYDISLEIVGNPAVVEEGTLFAGAIHTAPVRLTRIDPVGQNAEVWARMQQSAAGRWPSHGFGSRADRENVAREIMDRFPDSDYYPYALVLADRMLVRTSFAAAEDAVTRFRRSPAYPHLLVFAGLAAARAADDARKRGAIGDAVTKLQLYRYYNEEALRTGSEAVRGQAVVNARDADFLIGEVRKARQP